MRLSDTPPPQPDLGDTDRILKESLIHGIVLENIAGQSDIGEHNRSAARLTWDDIRQRPQRRLDLADRAGILGHEILIEREPFGRV